MIDRKYRIIQIPRGFKIQYKWLGLFWTDFSEPNYTYDSYLIGYTSDRDTTWIRQSLVEAKRDLDFARQFPMEYRGHQIGYGRWGEKVTYVDLSSGSDYNGRGYSYSRASSDLDRLKQNIDESIESDYKEKHKNDRLAVYENL